MTLSGFEFNPQAWSEEAYKVGIEISRCIQQKGSDA